MANKLDYVILDLLESTARNMKAHPLNLGGVSGVGGGAGGPPGGFIGWLPQTRVAYDEDELATLATSGTPSLLDNLNHIRYRLGAVESGGAAGLITIVDDTTPATYSGVDTIHFSGGVVITDLGSGDIRVTISGGGVDGDATYLRLDATNDPITGFLQVVNATPGAGALYVQSEGDSYTGDFEQVNSTDNFASSPVLFASRSISNGKTSNAALIYGYESTATGGTFSGGFLRFRSNNDERVLINPNVISTGVASFIDTNTAMTPSGKLLSMMNQGTEKFALYGDGIVNIASGATYNINGVPHTHASAGSLTVQEYDGSPIVTNVDKIVFSGATVIDDGGGDVTIVISGGSSGRYRQYIYTANVRSDHVVTQSFNVEGVLAVASGVAGAYIVAVSSGVLDSVYMYLDNAGTAGQTIVDVNKNGVTVFTDQSARPTIMYNDADKKYEAIPTISGLVKGDILTFDIDTVASGAAGLTIAPIITPIIGFGFVTSAGEPVTVLLDLE